MNIAETPLIRPIFHCVVSTDSPDELGAALTTIAESDPTLDHKRNDRNVCEFMIFGMGELHLEVIRHRLVHEYGLSFVMTKEVAASLLEPWVSLQIDFPEEFLKAVEAELNRREWELGTSYGRADTPGRWFFEGSMSAKNSLGVIGILRQLTENKGSYTMDVCEHRVQVDWE